MTTVKQTDRQTLQVGVKFDNSQKITSSVQHCNLQSPPSNISDSFLEFGSGFIDIFVNGGGVGCASCKDDSRGENQKLSFYFIWVMGFHLRPLSLRMKIRHRCVHMVIIALRCNSSQ